MLKRPGFSLIAALCATLITTMATAAPMSLHDYLALQGPEADVHLPTARTRRNL